MPGKHYNFQVLYYYTFYVQLLIVFNLHIYIKKGNSRRRKFVMSQFVLERKRWRKGNYPPEKTSFLFSIRRQSILVKSYGSKNFAKFYTRIFMSLISVLYIAENYICYKKRKHQLSVLLRRHYLCMYINIYAGKSDKWKVVLCEFMICE